MTAAEWMPSELTEKISAWNGETETIATEQAKLDRRLAELNDGATITAKNAAARLKEIDTARAERLALFARNRAQAVGALALLAETQKAGQVEIGRLAEASRKRQDDIRTGPAKLGIEEALAIRRAFLATPNLSVLRLRRNRLRRVALNVIRRSERRLRKLTSRLLKCWQNDPGRARRQSSLGCVPVTLRATGFPRH